jgi:hypothetical protein
MVLVIPLYVNNPFLYYTDLIPHFSLFLQSIGRSLPKMENTHGINVLGLAYAPAETIELVSRAGTHRGMMRPDNVFLAAIYGGILLSFGAAASLILNAEPWYTENAPGFPRLAGALIFPVGLVLIVLTGAELFTASNMVRDLVSFPSQPATDGRD